MTPLGREDLDAIAAHGTRGGALPPGFWIVASLAALALAAFGAVLL